MTGALSLDFDRYGERSDKPAIVIAHGLFGSSSNWRGIARKLAETSEVFAVDMRNHGASPWGDDHSYEALAADLALFIQTHVEGPAIVVGHSMGGKATMHLALHQPSLVAGIVVVDIAPVAYGHTHDGFIAAMKAIDTSSLASRSEADGLLADTIPELPVRQFLLQNLVTADEGYNWRINLNVLDKSMDDLTGFVVNPHSQYVGPTLFLYGAQSDYVTALTHDPIGRHFPRHELSEVSDAGHWVHAQQPAAVIAAIQRFAANL